MDGRPGDTTSSPHATAVDGPALATDGTDLTVELDPAPRPQADPQDPAVRHEIERSLTSVPGVLGARLVTSTGRSIDELHVLTVVDRSPSRTARDVRTALLARFGIPTDRRAISVVPLEQRPLGRSRSSTTRAVIERVAVSELGDASVAEVTLRERETVHTATSTVDQTATSPVDQTATSPVDQTATSPVDQTATSPVDRRRVAASRAVAEATLGAVAALVGGPTELELEGVELVEVAGHPLVAVVLHARTARAEALLSGTALVRGTVEDAVARAVMDAINRAMSTWTA